MLPQVKILSSNEKWTTVLYPNSNARSRIRTSRLIQQYNKSRIDVVNPSFIEGIEYE